MTEKGNRYFERENSKYDEWLRHDAKKDYNEYLFLTGL